MEFGKFQRDRNIFLAKTADLRIADGRDKFMAYHTYILDTLNLISDTFPPEAIAWYQASVDCMHRSISVSDAKRVDSEILEYRKKVLGGDYHMLDVKNPAQALTFLFQFAVEHPDDPQRLNTRDGGSLGQVVDEYTGLFIEFFGHGGKLVELLRTNFCL